MTQTGSTGQGTGQLIVRRGDELVDTVLLAAQEITIGRGPDNALVLPDGTVSGHHARLHQEGEDWLLTDVGSTNGTTVGGVRLLHHQPLRLADGAQIRIGPFDLLYQGPQRGPTPERADEEPAPAPPTVPHDRRPTAPAPLPLAHQPSRYLHNLPIIFQDNDFLRRFLLICESIWEPLEWRQDHIAMYFDARTCPSGLLPWLAGWLDLTFPEGWPEGRMRHVLAESTVLYRWRGTRYGLERMLEVFTGLTPRITEDADNPFVFRIGVTLPQGHPIDQTHIEALIRTHKPAHAGYVLDITYERAS